MIAAPEPVERAARPLVLLFVRPPVRGRVKTRLAATEGAGEALRIYRALAEDVHAAALAAQAEGRADLALCVDAGDDAEPAVGEVARWLPGARHLWAQGPGDLGQRLARAFVRGFAAGAPAVAAVGSDVVGLTPGRLAQAFEALTRADVALAPAPDGGYGLLALAAPAPQLFERVPWSTAGVAEVTRERAREAGLRLEDLAPLRDVDVAQDLDGALPWVSVLVPVLDEMPRLPERLGALLEQVRAAGPDAELLVVDGGSRDGSAEAAGAAGARVLVAPRGRGRQLAQAARAARGRWLWTVHADATARPGTLARVLAFARRGTHAWGIVRTCVEGGGPLLSALSAVTEIRARWLGTPYGDQGVLVQRALYDAVGGYADVPLMEDVLLARALRRRARPALVGGTLCIDGRRWRRHGLLSTSVRNLATLARFAWLGHDPARLAAAYDRGLARRSDAPGGARAR